MAAVVDKDTCTGCESCVDACPVEAISMDGNVAVVNSDDCIDCGACVGECPAEAISME
ncbi:MAG: 4Fe-4S binding protein [Victivallales bacterium]|nr:4Fe-4S binding protein [Victivallaceae bacterium]